MSNMSEDIWYAGSDTRPPMLDRTDFESWQQRIRLYCLGKYNGENAMIQSIDRQLRNRRLIRSLEKFIGGRLIVMEYPKDQPFSLSLNLWSYKAVFGIGGEKLKNRECANEIELVRKPNNKEHQSDTQAITMKMEILLEPTSNKLMVVYDLMIDDELLK
ncbi:hypothetical protein Tco_1104166 [Tanacetum coccineum]